MLVGRLLCGLGDLLVMSNLLEIVIEQTNAKKLKSFV
jgi:hypothetical protein